MKNLLFKKSKEATLGIELELQLIDPMTYDLISRAKDLIRNISTSRYKKIIKPEITQSTIEINSSIHTSASDLQKEMEAIRTFLLIQGKELGFSICGTGTHPFQKWTLNKIFPTKRFKNLFHQYRFLSKRSAVFGQHIHIGCLNADDALYLTHALARFVPHFIAISAASPFYAGIDTKFDTARPTIFNALPTSGVIPYLLTWDEFSKYFYKFRKLNIVSTMKDFHWDIRPKPEFGTVEIRVCDTPLTIEKAVIMAAYVQSLALYLLKTRPSIISRDVYYFYNYNRFIASRYGLEGRFVDPNELRYQTIADDILSTIKIIKKYTHHLNNTQYISQLTKNVVNKKNDAGLLRELHKKHSSLAKVVREQCKIWSK